MEPAFVRLTLFLLLIAAVVAMLTRRLRLPYSTGLVVAGMGLALLPNAPRIALTNDLLYLTLLPPLLFEAAFYLGWTRLRDDLPVILMLAFAGVAISAAVTAAGMHFVAGWGWTAAWVFGCLIAATDPVSVLATFREAGVQGRLSLLVEAESLLNDGTAAVAFALAAAIAAGQQVSAAESVLRLVGSMGGAVLCGGAVGFAAVFLAGQSRDHLVEVTFTAVAAWGSFLLAEQLHCSGVLATITAGLILGNRGPRDREAIRAFWEYAAFAANSLIFLLIGMHEASRGFGGAWRGAAVGIAAVLVSRAAAVYPLCALFRGSKHRVTASHQHALFWGGLRGALALALALGLPETMVGREAIVTVAFAAVAFSVFAQGLTMTPLLRRLGEIPAVGR